MGSGVNEATDANASDDEGNDWWMQVTSEMCQVCSATSVQVAAAVIEWWHHDWSVVDASVKAAAKRIRLAAK
jgi:hypothetical protein